MNLFEKCLVLKEQINGSEAETFLNYYYAKFFTGDISLMQDEEVVTLSFHKGRCIDLEVGVPNTGIDIGVRGNQVEWSDFRRHKSLSVATNRATENKLTTLGSPIRFRQNFNVVAQLIRVLANLEQENI